MTSEPFSDMPKLTAQLASEEAVRNTVYDDATGKAICPLTLCRGHPTIGIGRALDVNGLSDDEINYLFNNDVAKILAAFDASIPWWRSLEAPRQAVLIDMAFNMGIDGLMKWPNTLELVHNGDYAGAADAMRHSLWANQVKTRATKLADQMQSGEWQ